MIGAGFEHIGKDFRMDSSFLMRSGVDNVGVQIQPYFYPNPKKLPWLKKINPNIMYQYIHDINTNMDDTYLEFILAFYFIKQGILLTN